MSHRNKKQIAIDLFIEGQDDNLKEVERKFYRLMQLGKQCDLMLKDLKKTFDNIGKSAVGASTKNIFAKSSESMSNSHLEYLLTIESKILPSLQNLINDIIPLKMSSRKLEMKNSEIKKKIELSAKSKDAARTKALEEEIAKAKTEKVQIAEEIKESVQQFSTMHISDTKATLLHFIVDSLKYHVTELENMSKLTSNIGNSDHQGESKAIIEGLLNKFKPTS